MSAWLVFAPKTPSIIKDAKPVVRERGRRLGPRAAQRRMRKFVRNNDVPNITIMSLRHSFATAAIRSGMNTASVSKWLGHTDVTTTLNRYVRPMLTSLHDDVAIINAGYTVKTKNS